MKYKQVEQSDPYQRTHQIDQLNVQQAGQSVRINGWLYKKRQHGALFFINVKDFSGVVQVLISEQEQVEKIQNLQLQSCLSIQATVLARPKEMINPKMSTGEIELQAQQVHIYSAAEVLPIPIDHPEQIVKEQLRLKYRYLDLRNEQSKQRMMLRSETTFYIREFFHKEKFLELETPTLVRSTPEGARDYLVPSRVNPGLFYALAQSPQIYKQLSMMAGLERYFQIARCYRDEDPRGDRQPEFTQIDFEMSFVQQSDIFQLVEKLIYGLCEKIWHKDIGAIQKISYDQAIKNYGSDKPDLRFDLKLQDVGALLEGTDIQFIQQGLKQGHKAIAIVVEKQKEYFSRKNISELEELVKPWGLAGLTCVKYNENSLEGSLAKYLQVSQWENFLHLKQGDVILLAIAPEQQIYPAMGHLREQIAQKLQLYDAQEMQFLWVYDFPVFEWNEPEQRYQCCHHPFTLAKQEYWKNLGDEPLQVRGYIYDLVCNGYEIGSGSLRVYNQEQQEQIFQILQLSPEQIKEKFGFFVEALGYGTPPHGGMALGLDRLCMLACGEKSIKEVILFPKSNLGVNPMDECPSSPSLEQLEQLHIQVKSS